MDREEMVEADSNDMFENDLDRLSRDANPGPLLLERFYRTLKVIMMVGLERDMPPSWTTKPQMIEKDLPLLHIKYRSAFGVEILNLG